MYELVLFTIELMEKELKWRIINKHTHVYTNTPPLNLLKLTYSVNKSYVDDNNPGELNKEQKRYSMWILSSYENTTTDAIHCCISIYQYNVSNMLRNGVRLVETTPSEESERERDLFAPFVTYFANAKINIKKLCIISHFSKMTWMISNAFNILLISYALWNAVFHFDWMKITLHTLVWFRRNPNILKHSRCSFMHAVLSLFKSNDCQYFPKISGSWLYGLASGSCVTEIRIESCRKARAQFYDGYTANKTGKSNDSNIFVIIVKHMLRWIPRWRRKGEKKKLVYKMDFNCTYHWIQRRKWLDVVEEVELISFHSKD